MTIWFFYMFRKSTIQFLHFKFGNPSCLPQQSLETLVCMFLVSHQVLVLQQYWRKRIGLLLADRLWVETCSLVMRFTFLLEPNLIIFWGLFVLRSFAISYMECNNQGLVWGCLSKRYKVMMQIWNLKYILKLY